MENIATLGLRLDANGFLTGTRQVERGLNDLGATSAKVEGKMKNFATQSAFAFSSLASSGVQDITTVLRSLSSLGFAFGAVTGAVTLLGSSILDGLISAYTRARDESKLTADALMADARRIADMTKAALVVQLEAVMRQRNEILGKAPIKITDVDFGPGGNQTRFLEPSLSGAEVKRLAELDKRYRDLSRALRDVAKAEALVSKKETVTRAREMADAFKEQWKTAQDLADAMDKRFFDALRAAGPFDSIDKAFRAEGAPDFSIPREDLEAMAAAAGKVAEELDSAFKNAAEQRSRWMQGIAGLSAGVLQQAGGVTGVIGSAGAGLIGGIAGGPAGMALGAVNGLIDGITSMGAEAERSAEIMRELTERTTVLAEELDVLKGNMSLAGARSAGVRRDMAELAAELRILNEIAAKGGPAANVARDTIARLGEQYKALGLTLEIIQEETRLYNVALKEDLAVRRLMAMGRTEEAEALRLALEQQREYADAVKNGADATTLAALAEVHRAETIAAAMGKVQARIDSLARTISGLEDFRNSLLLSDTKSPTSRLAEARRQYDEILFKAQGGIIPGYDGVPDTQMYSAQEMQEAAGRLPAAAQTLLELSRLVNASGSGFQSDFKRVLEDTQGLIADFTALKSVEEQMLEELRQIRDNTGRGGEGEEGPRPRGRDREPNALLTVTQSGFTALVQKVDALAVAVNASARETRRALTALT